jgi:hypothetical protein
MNERAMNGRAGRAVSKRRPTSMASSTAVHPRLRVIKGRRPSRRWATAEKRARKMKSATPRAKPRG